MRQRLDRTKPPRAHPAVASYLPKAAPPWANERRGVATARRSADAPALMDAPLGCLGGGLTGTGEGLRRAPIRQLVLTELGERPGGLPHPQASTWTHPSAEQRPRVVLVGRRHARCR